MTQKTSKRTTLSPQTSTTSLQGIFRHWVIAGLLGVCFFVVGVLVTTLSIKASDTSAIDPQANLITSALFTLALISILWWLIESARAAILYISRNSKPAPKKKASSKKK
jgi:hypothetical protein